MSAIRRPRRSLALGLLLSCCLLALACSGPGDAPSRPLPSLPVLTDPTVVAADGLAPANGLDGQGSLFLGDGWGKPEGGGEPGDWGSMAWVVGREAAIHLFLPPGPPMDFYGRALPFPWAEGAPVQTMELLAGGRVVGRLPLVKDWSDVRIPLPPDLPRGQLIDLRLRFDHATRPEGDSRLLSAAFTQLAVLPRAVEDPKPFVEAHSFDPATRRVVLPAGGGLRLPVPAASHVEVRLKDLLSRCAGCRLSVELSGPGEPPRPLRTEDRQDVAEIRLGFDTGPRGLHNLWLRVESPQPLVRGSLELVLDEAVATPRPVGAAAPADVFVYLIDTLRADELAAYGGRPALTPRMNALATEAVTYLDARAPSSWTLPSVVSLLTGLYSDRHGVLAGSLQYDPARMPGLQHLLGRQGYRTVGISHSPIISATYGMSAGFGSFYLSDHLNSWRLRSEEARGLLASWLSQDLAGSPVFAYVHTVDPHAPYSPPARFRGAMVRVAARSPLEDGLPPFLEVRGLVGNPAEVSRLRSLYDGEVRYADQEFGRFIDFLKWAGLYDRSFVILAGDHGEEFAEHGGLEHGTTLFDEVLRVPLIVKYPGGRWAGERVASPVSLVDVAPTVLAEAGHPTPELDGRVLPGPGDAARRQPVYFEIVPYRDRGEVPIDLRGMVVDGVKCLENRAGVDRGGRPAPRVLAFDLAADRAEQSPLDQGASATVRCGELLQAWSRSRERQARAQRSQRHVSPEAIERLRALGYAD